VLQRIQVAEALEVLRSTKNKVLLGMRSVLKGREDAIEQQTVVEVVDQGMRLLRKDRLSIANVASIPIP
jgi:hypothetical protein